MSKYFFKYDIWDEGIFIQLFYKPYLGTKLLDLSSWNDPSELEITYAVDTIQEKAQSYPNECYRLDKEKGFFISHRLVSQLSKVEAKSLGLPEIFPHRIIIKTKNLGTRDFSINWRAPKNRIPHFFERFGSILKGKTDRESYLLSKEMFEILSLIDTFKSNSLDHNTAFISELKSFLPESFSETIDLDEKIQEITIRHAAAFSLNITGEKNSMSFNPILFDKRQKERSISSIDLIDEDEQLLTENEQRLFSARFKKNPEVSPTYLLEKNNYLFIDKSLRPVLKIVKDASKFDLEKRKQFARSPHNFIKEALESSDDLRSDLSKTELENEILAHDFDDLFIETRQFSDRVMEMEVWEAPDLPWLKSEPNDWRGDSFAFVVQGKTLFIKETALEETVNTIRKAIENNEQEIKINNENITPDKKFIELLEKFITRKPDPSNVKDPSPGETEGSAKGKQKGPLLYATKENFDSMEYNQFIVARFNPIDKDFPDALNSNTTLKQHQEDCLRWLKECYNTGFPGVLIADDMGLGKTLQALAFLALLQESQQSEIGPILIVAPVGLLKNWEEECRKHLKDEGLGLFCKLYGNNLKEFKKVKGKDIDIGYSSLDVELLKPNGWILTTYETLRDYSTSLSEIRFSCVVFDELQKAKNPRSIICKATKVLNKDFAIGLTGTPVENSLADLWTIMDILSPGRLKDLKGFIKQFPEPSQDNPQEGLENLKFLAKQLLERNDKYPAPILRRMKDDLKEIDLPQKVIVPHLDTTFDMPKKQEEIYTDIYTKLKSQQITMIEALHKFKTISLHPYHPDQAAEVTFESYIKDSARLTITFKVLEKIKTRGEKALIFLESRAMQPVLATIIKQKFNLPQIPMIINGLVSGAARQDKVNRFQSQEDGFDVMIISPKAGGVGLTLTAANNVIHLERWWNPAVEDQCTDRAYRIGQNKSVNVYMPIAKNSILRESSFDCILNELLIKKRALAKGLFVPTAIGGSELSGALIKDQDSKDLTIEEVDLFETGKDFEEYVAVRIKRFSLKVSLTQESFDYGADLIVENKRSEKTAIIQCKHRANKDRAVSPHAAEEVLKAQSHYSLETPLLFIVSNAQSVTASCREKCENGNIYTILRDDLLRVGEIIRDYLQ